MWLKQLQLVQLNPEVIRVQPISQTVEIVFASPTVVLIDNNFFSILLCFNELFR
jgi:hypothetical protein